MNTPLRLFLVTTLAAVPLTLCAPAGAQMTPDQIVVSSYRSPTVGEQGGLWLVESSTGAVTPVTGLSGDLTGGSSSVSKGANSVLLGPAGELYAGEVGPPGSEIDLHRITLSGNAVASDELLSVGTASASYGGSINQTALLPDGRILVGVAGIDAGTLAGRDLGIVDFVSGSVVAVPADTGQPPATTALCLGPACQVAYFVVDNGGGTSNLFSVPIPTGGTATNHATFCGVVSNLMLDREGNRLVATTQQLGTCAGTLIEVDLATFAWSTCGDWDALNALAPDGGGGLFVATLTLGTPPASLLAVGAPPNCSATAVTGGPSGGWSQPSGVDTVHRNNPRRYCVTSPNSAGTGALMGWEGTTSIASNDLVLIVTACPPRQFGLFFYGTKEVQLPAGDGYHCVGGSLFRLVPAVKTDAAGIASRWLDHGNLPQAGAILAGSTWSFQFGYRDPGFGSAGFNYSDALAVTFCD